MGKPGITRCAGRNFIWGDRTYVMGIINLSPDSFSGDGVSNFEDACRQARRMESEGADILDIGGESTRPGTPPVPIEEEIRRVVPLIRRTAPLVHIPISIDSYKYEVVRPAIEAGASIINDQWGLKKDRRLAELSAAGNFPIILMSNQRDRGGFDTALQRDTGRYEDVVSVLINDLRAGIATALKSGVSPDNIIVDPGLGFGKTWQNDLEIIRRLDELKVLGRPILLGPSRKSFIKMVLDLPVSERVEGTAAAVAIGINHGADIVRVHDVRQITRVCKVCDAIVRAR
ncbi:MAG: dihydropteroate synthase [Dehalococcoidales bacterium]|nr:dihydropteroate synthase [Dehalococcoidales bacterium]